MAKKPIREKTERAWEDPVTHELHRLELTPLQLEYEKVVAQIDRSLLKFDAANGDRMLQMVVDVIRLKRRHTG